MLVRLMPEQVTDYWDLIRDSIDESVAPTAGEEPDRMNRILESLLAEKMICWASMRKDAEGNKIIGLVTTTIINDWCTNTNNLLIYSVFATEQSQEGDWVEGFETIVKYAKGKGCHRIIAYTKDDSDILKIAKKFDADLSFRFISIAL